MKDRAPRSRVPSAPAARTAGGASVEVFDPENRIQRAERDRLRDWLATAVQHLAAGGDVRVRLVGDTEMTGLHARHLGEDATTDVLTFDLADGAAARTRELDVDVIVCVDEARRQGAARGHAPERELLLYALHGVLHCLGYDDTDEDAYLRMHAAEDEVLAAIGVGATFRAREGDGA